MVLALIHWTNFDGTKILFIFYDSTFKAMTFSMCPEADQNISNRLKSILFKKILTKSVHPKICKNSPHDFVNIRHAVSLNLGLVYDMIPIYIRFTTIWVIFGGGNSTSAPCISWNLVRNWFLTTHSLNRLNFKPLLFT